MWRTGETVRDEDGAAPEAAVVEIFHGVGDGVERVRAGV
jgi:hypothetical protein